MIDLDKSLLGFIEQGHLRRILDLGIRPEHIYDPLYRNAFEFSQRYWEDSSLLKTPTKKVLLEEFPSIEVVEPEESLTWVVEKLQERFTRTRVQNVLRKAAEDLDELPLESAREAYQELWEVLASVTERKNRSDISSNVLERQSRYATRVSEFDPDPFGLGLPDVDKHIGGIRPGELAVVSAYAKTGKTQLLCKSAVEARKKGLTPLLVSMEVSVPDMEDRLDGYISGLDMTSISNGNLTREEVLHLKEAQEEFASLGHFYVEKPTRDDRTVQSIVNRAREVEADIILIDQLSFIKPRRDYRDRRSAYEEIMEDLKSSISEDEESMFPTIMAVQLNRASVQEGEELGMQNLAVSSSIEQFADIVFGLQQSRELRTNNSMFLKILGIRRGSPEEWLLNWSLKGQTKIESRGTIASVTGVE